MNKKKFISAIILTSILSLSFSFSQNPEWIIWSDIGYANVITIEENYVWVGTSEGLVKIDRSSSEKMFFNKSNSVLPDNVINTIKIDKNGNKWVGTAYGGFAKFDETTWTVYKGSNSRLLNDYVKSIEIDERSNIWIGTYGGGIAMFDGLNWTICTKFNSGLPDNYIYTLAIDKQGNKWIGTSGGGIVKFDGKNWIVYNTKNSKLPTDYIWLIVIDEQNNKWIGTNKGLVKFDGVSWTVYNTDNSMLPDNEIHAIAVDKQGIKWIGTNKGLVRFDGVNWTIYNMDNSLLPSNHISAIAVDEQGNKWIGTGKGFVIYHENGIIPYVKPIQAVKAVEKPKVYIPIGHSAWILNLDLSRDGRYAVSASMDGSAILWDLRLNKEIRKYKKNETYALSCAISKEQNIILLGHYNGEIEIWNLKTGELIATLKEHSKPVASLGVSLDDRYFVSSGFDGKIIIWDLQTKKVYKSFAGPEGLVINSVSFIPNTTYIIAGFNDGSAKVLDYSNGRLVFNLRGHEGEVYDVAVSPDGRYAVTACSDKILRLWSLSNGSIIKQFYDFKSEIVRVAFSKNGQLFAAGGGGDHTATDFTIRVYSLNGQKLIKTLAGHQFTVSGIKFSPDDKFILSSSWDMTLKYWDIAKGLPIKTLTGLVGICYAIAPLSSMKNVIFGFDDKTVKILDLTSGKVIKTIVAHTEGVSDVFVNESNNRFFTGSDDGTVKEWNLQTYKLEREFKLHNGSIQGIVALDKLLVTVGVDGNMVLCDLQSGQKKLINLLAHNGGVLTMDISPDKRYIATAGKDFKIKLWHADNFEKPSVVLSGHTDNINVVRFSPDGRFLISGGGSFNSDNFDNSIKIWSIPDRNQIKTLREHSSIIHSFEFIATKNTFVSLSLDGELNIWSYPDFSHIKKVKLETSPSAMRATSDGNFLLVSLGDGTIRFIETENWTEVIKQISFTDGNWIAITQDNYYYSSKDAVTNISYVLGEKIYSFEQFDLQYNRPDLVLKRLGYSSLDLVKAYQKAYEKRLRKMGFDPAKFEQEFRLNSPEVSIKSPDNFSFETKQPEISLTFTASDNLFNLDRYFVSVNGVPVFGVKGKKFDKPDKKAEQVVTVPLSSGVNIIKISALNEKGVESLAEQIEVIYNPENPIKPKLYIITVGVSKFLQREYNLTYADKDAADIAKLFEQQSIYFDSIKVYLLQNQKAVKENIVKLKEQLRKTTPDDYIVLFIATHGLLDNELDYYLATHDIDFYNPQKRGLRYDELENILDEIPARNKILLIDACHSGEVDKEEGALVKEAVSLAPNVTSRGIKLAKASETSIGLKTSFELMRELFADLRRNNGAIVISSAGGAEFAYETPAFKNGVFTFSVIEALKDAKCDANSDGKISVNELRDYVGNRVRELTGGKQNPTSRVENIENNFIIWKY